MSSDLLGAFILCPTDLAVTCFDLLALNIYMTVFFGREEQQESATVAVTNLVN